MAAVLCRSDELVLLAGAAACPAVSLAAVQVEQHDIPAMEGWDRQPVRAGVAASPTAREPAQMEWEPSIPAALRPGPESCPAVAVTQSAASRRAME